ncbi:hypothetical protein PII47_21745 [Pseudomonas sp. 21TX0197]|nr:MULTISPECIES: hypothetical protein [unclassified Pseudomonas]MDB6446027.1 hypothetical protein [Pseudomonas sp. 21TX0197]SFX14181.1 hypothetical protein SAMN03159309_00528 [Pseudomonas sp. NFACC36]
MNIGRKAFPALRTRPAPNIGEVIYMPDFALTRRLDGSYTMAISGKARLEIIPQGLRYAAQLSRSCLMQSQERSC